MLAWWACKACSTRESCKHVYDEPLTLSEVETEHCGSAGGRDRKWSAGPWTRPYRFVSLAGRTDYEAGSTVWLYVLFLVSCTPAGLIRPISLSGLYLSAGSLLQWLFLSWKPDAALHQRRATHTHSGASGTHSPFFSKYRRNSNVNHVSDLRTWRTISHAPISFLGQALVHEIYL